MYGLSVIGFVGRMDASRSSNMKRYPSQGFCDGLNIPSPYAAQKSVAFPSALFNSIIEVVSKTTYLGFHFDDRNQRVSGEDNEIPLFTWPVEARQRSRLLFGYMDLNVRQGGILNNSRDKPYEAVGMLTAGN